MSRACERIKLSILKKILRYSDDRNTFEEFVKYMLSLSQVRLNNHCCSSVLYIGEDINECPQQRLSKTDQYI